MTSGDADSYIQLSRSTGNYGDKKVLRVRGSRSGAAARAMFRFDLSALPADVHVDSAHLELFVRQFRRMNLGWLSLHRVVSGWTEGDGRSGDGVSWDFRGMGQRWGSAGGDFISVPSFSTTIRPNRGSGFRLDVTADVAQMVAGEIPNHGWILKHSYETDNAKLAVASRKSRHVEWQPRLVVVTSPGGAP